MRDRKGRARPQAKRMYNKHELQLVSIHLLSLEKVSDPGPLRSSWVRRFRNGVYPTVAGGSQLHVHGFPRPLTWEILERLLSWRF